MAHPTKALHSCKTTEKQNRTFSTHNLALILVMSLVVAWVMLGVFVLAIQ